MHIQAGNSAGKLLLCDLTFFRFKEIIEQISNPFTEMYIFSMYRNFARIVSFFVQISSTWTWTAVLMSFNACNPLPSTVLCFIEYKICNTFIVISCRGKLILMLSLSRINLQQAEFASNYRLFWNEEIFFCQTVLIKH